MSSESKMEKLRKRLYERGEEDTDSKSDSGLSAPDESDTPSDWSHDHNDKADGSKIHGWLDNILMIAGVFSVLAAGFAVVVIAFNPGSVSPNQVGISVSGPETISAGETVPLRVAVTNNNDVALQEAVLTVSFPPGTRQPDTSGEELRRVRNELGSINPNQTIQTSVAASLFGQQNEERTVTINLEYRVEESNAIFVADGRHTVTIGELPVAMSISGPQQTAPGQPINFDVSVQSNSAKPLRNLIVRADYPFGFTSSDVSPDPSYRDFVWSLGDLEPGGSRDISISGRFEDGVSAGQRTFSFTSGIANPSSPTSIGTLFASRSSTLKLDQSQLPLSVNFSNVSQNEVITSGDDVSGVVSYENNTDVTLRGAEVTLFLDGAGIDIGTVESDSGLFRQSERQITWNSQTHEALESIAPSQSGDLDFAFNTKEVMDLVGTVNPTAEVRAVANAPTPQDSDLPSNLNVEATRSPRLASGLSVKTESLRNEGPFSHGGPLPPQVDRETEYTIRFVLSNTTNQLQNVRLQAAVPAFVEITGEPQTTSGSFAFNETAGRFEWSLDTVAAGAGYNNSPEEIFIPVTVTPTLSQEGSEVNLLRNISVTAFDEFIGQEITSERVTPPTTRPDDATGGVGTGVVDGGD